MHCPPENSGINQVYSDINLLLKICNIYIYILNRRVGGEKETKCQENRNYPRKNFSYSLCSVSRVLSVVFYLCSFYDKFACPKLNGLSNITLRSGAEF